MHGCERRGGSASERREGAEPGQAQIRGTWSWEWRPGGRLVVSGPVRAAGPV